MKDSTEEEDRRGSMKDSKEEKERRGSVKDRKEEEEEERRGSICMALAPGEQNSECGWNLARPTQLGGGGGVTVKGWWVPVYIFIICPAHFSSGVKECTNYRQHVCLT